MTGPAAGAAGGVAPAALDLGGHVLPYVVVDVFTDRAFAGNPLAVVLDADGLTDAALQALAGEFHLSETAFPVRAGDDAVDYRLRIFTPEVELPFAGHPSIGAAWVLARLGRLRPARDVLRQECGAGVVTLRLAADGAEVELTGAPPSAGEPLDAAPLLVAVGLQPGDHTGPPPRECGTGLPFAYLPVRPDAVPRAAPDLAALRRLGPWLGVSVFSWDGERARTRVFVGEVGVTEDPATGSAALGLGAWLAASGLTPPDADTGYEVVQGVELGRPSLLRCRVVTQGGRAVRCRVSGRVVPVARGEIRVPPRG